MMFASLLRIGVISITGYAFATEVIPAENSVPGRYIVTLNDEHRRLSSSSLDDFIQEIIQGDDIGAQSHGTVDQVYESVFPGFAADLDEAGLQNVLESPHVVSVEEDGFIQEDEVGSWGLDRIDDEDLPLDGTYEPTFGNDGEGVTAYIIDSGILHTHVEFEGRATQEYNSVGDGKNYDCRGHGTHVAGTVGAKTYGVAKKVKLVGVKVLNCYGRTNGSWVIAGINWVKANAKKPATANMSLAGYRSYSLNLAVKSLVASGVTTVVAAGNERNDACLTSPASEPDVITVGCSDEYDAFCTFSNWGTCVDIFAPGFAIISTDISSNTATSRKSGTSMASPHVCGAAALYLGQNPNLTPTMIRDMMLKDSIADKITGLRCGSPNKLLHVGASYSPTVSPAPSNAPTSCLAAGKTEVDNYGCLPYTKRNGKDMVYLYNSSYGYQTDHKAIATKCGGQLASFTSQEESDSILTKSITCSVWIGLMQKTPCDDESKGCWYWSDGTPLVWLNWSPGEPNSVGRDVSVEVRPPYNKWYDNMNKMTQRGGVYLLPKCFTSIEGCYLYKPGSKPCSSNVSPTKSPSTTPSAVPTPEQINVSPTKSPSTTPSAAPTPEQKCEGLGKKDCKNSENCQFGKNKIAVDCIAKKKTYQHDCSQHSVNECTPDNAAMKNLCEVKNGACAHVCDGESNSACKKKKDTTNKKKVCTNKMKNPCKKCKPKSCNA